ncbi:MAG: T9SS type A sorting domain-containing protein [Ignavibacteriae bacterium]|nr:T9SS type A sorting domain-containing protein [Ignavibacteriota bacterium]
MKKKNVRTEHSSVLIALFVFAVLFVCLPTQTKAQYQPPDSCLKLLDDPYEELHFQNPDSVKVDSCEDSPTYKQVYAKYDFYVRFLYNIKPRNGTYPPDTIIEFTWQDIDTNYHATRTGFSNIESKYGTYSFREVNTEFPDTTQFIPRRLLIRFINYVNIDSVCNDINKIEYVYLSWYLSRYGYWGDVIEMEEYNLKIYPNPAADYIIIQNHSNNYFDKVEICSVIGENIITKGINIDETYRLDITYFQNGIYFIKVGNIHKTLIVNK